MTPTSATTDGQDHGTHGASSTLDMMKPLAERGAEGGIDDLTATQKMLSATTGSILTSLLMTPLDVVRVRWQAQPAPQGATIDFSRLAKTTNNLNGFSTTNLGVTACCREVFFINNNNEACFALPSKPGAGAGAGATAAGCAVEETERKTFSSTMDGLRKIARNEGFTGLWRGLSPTLVMAVPANIIYFTGYDWLRFNPKSPIAQRFGDDVAPLAAGIAARSLAATVVGPIELFRTRLQASAGNTATGHLTNTFTGIKEMVSANGYTSLWRGLTLTLWRDVPFSGIYWWGYEVVRGKLTDMRETSRGRALETSGSRSASRRRSQSHERHAETFVDSFVAGAASGSIASIVTMPFDVGKTRTQVFRDGQQAAAGAAKNGLPEKGTMVRLLWHIFRTEGIGGLWKGWIPRTLKVAPACAIMISSYEIGKRTFQTMNDKAREAAAET